MRPATRFALLFVPVLGAILPGACDTSPGDKPRARHLKLEPRDVEVKLVEYGEIVAREVRAVSAPISGEITWVEAEGTQLKRGETVLRMNTDKLASTLEEDRKAGVGLGGRLKTSKAVAKAIALNRKAAIKTGGLRLQIARQRLAEAKSHPTPSEKKLAELNLKAAQLRAQHAAAEQKALQKLAKDGFSSKAKAKAAQLALIRAKAELARAGAAYRETLAGRPPQTIRWRQAEVKKAELSLAQAKFNAEADVAAATQAVAVAQTRYDVYRKRLDRVKADIDSAAAKTPIDGVVALVDVWKGGSELSPVQVGETHRRGREMLKMADVSALRVRVHVNERDIVGVSVGQVATARLVADPSRVFRARVAEIASFADDKNRQLGSLAMDKSGLAGVNVVEVRLDLDVPADATPPRLGSSALVEIVTARMKSALTVPLGAVTWRDGKAFVTAKRDEATQEFTVKLGRGTSGEAIVESGLKAGDRVLLPAGAEGSRDGR